KLGWDELLFGDGLAQIAATHGQGDVQGLSSGQVGGTAGVQSGGFDPNIYTAEAKGIALGYPDKTSLAWFAQRSMAVYGQNGHVPDVPTLMVQGTVDTLFNVNEAWANHDEMEAAHPGLPVKLIAFCGGHVSCPTGGAPQGINYQSTSSSGSVIAPSTSASTYTEAQTIQWFDVYLRGHDKNGNAVTDTQPEVVYQDQNGNFWPASTFPTVSDPGASYFDVVPVKGQLLSTGVPTGFGPAGEATVVTDGASAANDPGALTVPVVTAKGKDVQIVGEPHISASVEVQGTSTDLFFRLIDEATGQVVDLQTSALRIDNVAGGQGGLLAAATTPVTISLDMVGVAYDLPAGDTLELQVATSGPSFVPNRGSSVVTIDGNVSIPTM
ncbi:MAG TPA: CocE/NonD family hydrolase C-terminal non-catalytic domain-containing protein, partial [Acidimicrobiales bacterium]|nr:CocE/NonD family hydrolase C-terminal non-catalytic domain-containing protein [Acidimicrobiales bacterium]